MPNHPPSREETGRTEHRMDVSLAGRLKVQGGPEPGERVVIRNISSHGARVISARSWHARDHVRLTETVGDFHLDAQVVYCERLTDSRFAVGLRFGALAPSRAAAASRSYW